MIEALLAELGRLLPAGARRRRVLLEAEDHLRCAADAGVAAGADRDAAEAAAVRAFGPPEAVARDVREQLGAAAAAVAARLGFALLGALAAVYALRFTEVANDAGQPRWWPADPVLSVVTLLAIEVAVVAGALTLLRVVRHRSGVVSGGVRPALLRGVLVATGCGVVASLSEGVTALRHLDAVRSSHLALAVVALAAVILLLAVPTALASARGLTVARSEAPEPHPVDDLASILPGPLRRTGLIALIDVRRHPWRVCAVTALAVGALQASGLAWRDGAWALVAGAFQAAAVVAAFAVLGPVLGLRARRVTPGPEDGLPAAPAR